MCQFFFMNFLILTPIFQIFVKALKHVQEDIILKRRVSQTHLLYSFVRILKTAFFMNIFLLATVYSVSNCVKFWSTLKGHHIVIFRSILTFMGALERKFLLHFKNVIDIRVSVYGLRASGRRVRGCQTLKICY